MGIVRHCNGTKRDFDDLLSRDACRQHLTLGFLDALMRYHYLFESAAQRIRPVISSQ
jgi:hypothetical protein